MILLDNKENLNLHGNVMAQDDEYALKRRFIKNLRAVYERIGVDTGRGFAAYLAKRFDLTPVATGLLLNEFKSMPSKKNLDKICSDANCTVDELYNGIHSNVEPASDMYETPIIGYTTAGAFTNVQELEPWQVEERVFSPLKQNGYRFALRVVGTSMENPAHPKNIPDGSVILFNAAKWEPETGDIILAKVRGADEITCKKFVRDADKIYLEPLNPRYPIIDKEFKVLATAEGMAKLF